MDFQKFVDGFELMTCVISVEKLPEGKWGKIRIVAGNKAYVDSIENMPDVPQAFKKKFIPNSEYQDYFPYPIKSTLKSKCLWTTCDYVSNDCDPSRIP